MPDLAFRVESVKPVDHAAAPLLAFKVLVTNRVAGEQIHSGMLRCRVDLEPSRRSHDDGERERLVDLFDRPERWGRTVRRLAWAEVVVYVPAFKGSVVVEVPVPCTADRDLSATRYLVALRGGDVHVGLSFRGTVLHDADGRGLQAALVAQDEPAHALLPLTTWTEMMDRYFPKSGWLRVRADLYDRLARHKARLGHATLELALESLLPADAGGP